MFIDIEMGFDLKTRRFMMEEVINITNFLFRLAS
jgi:hypothetical protein